MPGLSAKRPNTNYTDDSQLPEITDEVFIAALGQAKPFTVLILRAGPRYSPPGPDRDPEVAAKILEHGKRNFRLRAAGLFPIICPIADGSGLTGVGVFDASPEEVDRIYAADPAVIAGVLTYEIHPTRTFPDSCLQPAAD